MKRSGKQHKGKRGYWSKYFDKPVDPWPLAVHSVGYNHCLPGEPIRMVRHPWHHWFDDEKGRVLPTLTMVHVIRGEGFFESAESGRLEVPENSLIFAFPGVRHYYCYSQKTGWVDEWLEVEGGAILPLLAKCGIDAAHPVARLGGNSRVAAAYMRIFDLARHGASAGRLAACAYDVIAQAVEEVRSPSSEKDPVDEMLVRLGEAGRRNSAGSIARAAAGSGLSASRMRTVFKSKTGMSPKRYQLKNRLERAARLLDSTGDSITHIAESVGFSTPSAFSNAFSREYGVPPARYRRNRVRR